MNNKNMVLEWTILQIVRILVSSTGMPTFLSDDETRTETTYRLPCVRRFTTVMGTM